MTEIPSVRKHGNNGNNALIGKAKNNSSDANIQEISVSIDNICL